MGRTFTFRLSKARCYTGPGDNDYKFRIGVDENLLSGQVFNDTGYSQISYRLDSEYVIEYFDWEIGGKSLFYELSDGTLRYFTSVREI